MKCVDLVETFRSMAMLPTEKLKDFVARELIGLRLNYMQAHEIETQDEFCEKVGADKRSVYNWEKAEHLPRVDELNAYVQACESNLAEFFSVLVKRADLAAIERKNVQEEGWLDALVKGLSHPETSKIVRQTAENVQIILKLLEAKSS